MKKLILTLPIIFICLNIIAQETKPWLLVARYNEEKKGICSNKKMIFEGINDYKEFDIKSKILKQEHISDDCSCAYVSERECVIVYEYQKKITGQSCSPTAFYLVKGATIEKCKEQFATYFAKNPKVFNNQPNIVLSWQGKSVLQK